MPSEERVMRAREVLAAEYEATAPAGKYVARDIRNGILSEENKRTIRAMLAFSDEGSGIGELREGDGWLPIDQAPKDGEWFLAAQDGEIYPCQWLREEYDEGAPYEGWYDLFNESFEDPTHFRPLPSPPDIDRSGLAQEME